MDFTLSLLLQFAVATPLYLVWLVGIVLAVTRRHEAPAASRLVLIALTLFLVTGIAGTVANAVLPVLVLRGDLGLGPARVWLVLGTVVNAAGWVLLLLALFPRRRPGGPNVGSGPRRGNPDPV